MSSAITLNSLGDEFFKTQAYPQAIEQYRASLKIDPNQADVWFKKGLVHKIQSQFSKALFAFSKAGELDEKCSNTYEERSLLTSLRDPSVNPSQYFSEVYSPLICKPEYLLELKQFQEGLPEIRRKPFEDQLKLVIQLLQFLQKYLVSTDDSYPFVREVLSQNDDRGRKQRLTAIGLTVLKFLPETIVSFTRNWLKDDMDPKFLNFLKTAQEDIYLEDSKKVWRMIFETIYFFPREERGKYVGNGNNNMLPWGVQSWYLLDFCGAVMSSDETIERLKKNKGIYCVPYQYYDDNKSWQQSYFFQSLANHCLITKVACRDLIKEAQPLQSFFTQLLNKDPDAKLKPLPHLTALIRYSKQLFNTHRLLCILPLSCYNHPMTHASFGEMGFPVEINLEQVKLFEKVIKETCPIQRRKELQRVHKKLHVSYKKQLEASKACLIQIKDELQQLCEKLESEYIKSLESLESSISDETVLNKTKEQFRQRHEKTRVECEQKLEFYNKQINSKYDKNDTQARKLAQNNLYEYIFPDLKQLKYRLAIIRKLQLVGDTFIPRNWTSQELKRINFIDTFGLCDTRARLTHVEESAHYFNVTKDLESDPIRLQAILKELQTLREQIHEDLAARQRNFKAWQKRSEGWNNEHFEEWVPFIQDYWTSVQNYYTSNDEKMEYIPNESLLSQTEITDLLSWMSLPEQDPFCDVLNGKKPWPEVTPKITVSDSDEDKKNMRAADQLLKKAKKAYSVKRRDFQTKKRDSQKKRKDDRKEKIARAMTDNFPAIKTLRTALQASSKQSYTSTEIFKVLRNRLEALKQLFQEQGLPSDKLLKGPLLKALETDSNFLLSTTYLLEQIFELLNTHLVRVHLESINIPIEVDLPRYWALRNHLAHSDPIYESLEFPYYEMQSNASELMAAVFAELNQAYGPVIMSYHPEALTSTELAAIESQPPREKVKQAEALDPVLF